MTQAGYTPPQKSMPPKAKSPKKPKKNKKRKKGIGMAGVVSLVICLIAVLIGSCTLFLYAQTAPYADKFLPNTSISGYALGGLTAQEGAAALAMLTDDAVSAWQYTLTWGERTYTLDGAGAAKAAAAIAARTVVPMHFNVPRLKLDIAGPEAFLEAMGGAYARAGSVLDVKSAPAGVVLMTPSR